MQDLTGFQRDLLFIVAGLDGPNGLEVKAELETYYEDNVRHGRLYPNLDTLVEKGLVEKGSYNQRTNKYVLTDRGRRELMDRFDWQERYLPDDLIEALDIRWPTE